MKRRSGGVRAKTSSARPSSRTKYIHHIADAIVRARNAPPAMPKDRGSEPTPMPIAITDSPKTMISSRPCRSTRCAAFIPPSWSPTVCSAASGFASASASTELPAEPLAATRCTTTGVTNWSSSASIHSPQAGSPSKNPAAVTDSAHRALGSANHSTPRPCACVNSAL